EAGASPSSGSVGNTLGPLKPRMRRRPKPLPWRNLISATSSAGGSWYRSGTSLERGRKKRSDRRRALELLAASRDSCTKAADQKKMARKRDSENCERRQLTGRQ